MPPETREGLRDGCSSREVLSFKELTMAEPWQKLETFIHAGSPQLRSLAEQSIGGGTPAMLTFGGMMFYEHNWYPKLTQKTAPDVMGNHEIQPERF